MTVNRTVCLRFDEAQEEKRLLLEATSVSRKLNLGTLVYDNARDVTSLNIRHTGFGNIEFEPVHIRFVSDVTIYDEILPVRGDTLILDHLTLAMEARPDTIGRFVPVERHLKRVEEAQAADAGCDTENELTLVVHNEGGSTWGHWLIQNLPKIILFFQHYPQAKVALPRYPADGSFAASLRAYGIAPDRIVRTSRDKALLLKRAAFIDPIYKFGIHPWILSTLRNLPDIGQSVGSKVFIRRDRTRRLTNFGQLLDIGRGSGFSAHTLGKASFEDQVKTWRTADAVIGTLGSDLTGLVYARRDVPVLVLSPEFHGDLFFADLSAAVGTKWSEIQSGNMTERAEPVRMSDFTVSPAVFSQALETLWQ